MIYELARNTVDNDGNVTPADDGEFYSLYYRDGEGLARWILDLTPQTQRRVKTQ